MFLFYFILFWVFFGFFGRGAGGELKFKKEMKGKGEMGGYVLFFYKRYQLGFLGFLGGEGKRGK